MYTGAYKLGINLMGGTGLSVDDHVAMLNRVSGSGWSGREVFIQPIAWNEEGYPVLGTPTF